MEPRKQKEIEYYDKKAKEWLKEKRKGDFEGFEPLKLSSFKFLYQLLKRHCQNKIVLDYGCGNGIHAIEIVRMGAKKVIGIDLSEKSLEIAKERAKQEGLEEKIEFLKMDCEKMEFPDNFFDVVFDGGTFSSLDLKKAIPEISRVLKKEGVLIGIETFGHNPLANLKRKINKLTGKRTLWAVEHIFQEKDLRLVRNYFNKTETYYFHPISCLVFPFSDKLAGSFLLKQLELIDKVFLKMPFFKKYAFKVVFLFSDPFHS